MPVGVTSFATSTGGSTGAHVDGQPRPVLPDDAHFVMKFRHGNVLFKATTNVDGLMVLTSINDVAQPDDVFSRTQQLMSGPQLWFKDAQNQMVIDASVIPSVVTEAEMLAPTGHVDIRDLKNVH